MELLCEAIPWPEELPAGQRQAIFKRARSFSAQSGALPVRVLVILAAPQGNGCPHLNANNLCDIYARRPAICRTYPAETHPFQVLDPARRRCPPECWGGGGEPYMRDSRYVSAELRKLISVVRDRAIIEAESMQRICRRLRIQTAALANEGYVVHRPPPEDLLAALRQRHQPFAAIEGDAGWCFVSGLVGTLGALEECAAEAMSDSRLTDSACRYVSLFEGE